MVTPRRPGSDDADDAFDAMPPTHSESADPSDGDGALADGGDDPTLVGAKTPKVPTSVQHRPGSGAIALDEPMRQSGVDKPITGAPPVANAATIVGPLVFDDLPPHSVDFDEAAPTEVLKAPPPSARHDGDGDADDDDVIADDEPTRVR